MSRVYVSSPKILVVEYRQERGDPDYGLCMWATFTFDLDQYSMTIRSDCGNYSYGWTPTPETESFVHLLCRLSDGYLLYKISDPTIIQRRESGKKLLKYIRDCEEIAGERIDDYDMAEAMEARFCDNETEFYHTVYDALRCSKIRDELYTYDIYDCIEKDYPANAKKIVQVFMDHIQPFLREEGKK